MDAMGHQIDQEENENGCSNEAGDAEGILVW
jgi:hypothetical protein